jgi:hypothetical protein
MVKVAVNPQTVQAASSQMKQAGANMHEAAGDVVTGTPSDPGFQTPDAVARFCAAWSTALTAYANACDSVSARLSTTATVYTVMEAHLTDSWG